MVKNEGFFIAIEGIDGIGKTTQIEELEAYFNGISLPVKRTKEPTDSVYGQEIRRIAQNGRANVTPEHELELFLKDRELDVTAHILPSLDTGMVVLVDRYLYSNIAYQGALGLEPDKIRAANAHFPVPDLVVLLDAEPEQCLERIRVGRGAANQGYEQVEFLKQVRERFNALPDANIVRVDATKPLAEVTREVRTIVVSQLVNKTDLLIRQP